MLLFFKNLVFTVLVPGTVAVLVPYRIVSRTPALVARTGEGVRGG